MPTCFVIQPFDGGEYDRRYREVFYHAITAAQLEPYRVDQDHKVIVPIEDIERGIREAQVCLAEITLDKPNVWFEVGFAIACGKRVVLVCSDERPDNKLRHRVIIQYKTKSPSDFQSLQHNITQKLIAYSKLPDPIAAAPPDRGELTIIPQPLNSHEVALLSLIAESDWGIPEADAHARALSLGHSPMAISISKNALEMGGLIQRRVELDHDDDEYNLLRVTPSGWKWIQNNKDRFNSEYATSAYVRPLLVQLLNRFQRIFPRKNV